MPGDLSYSDTGQLTARSERGAESVRLTTVAGLEDAVANLRIGIEQAERRLAEASRAHREALDAWTSLTASLGLSIKPEPADLLGFLAARDVVVDRHVARDEAQEALAAEMAQRKAIRLRFGLLMPEPECAALAEAIAAAQQTIERGGAAQGT
jgi:hypothetical protein